MMTDICAHQGRMRCWPCMTDACYDKPIEHVWWDGDDLRHAQATGQPPPSGLCGCAWCGEPALERIRRGDQE